MLIETQGGFDDMDADCTGWLREAGFSRTRVAPLVGPEPMVTGVQRSPRQSAANQRKDDLDSDQPHGSVAKFAAAARC